MAQRSAFDTIGQGHTSSAAGHRTLIPLSARPSDEIFDSACETEHDSVSEFGGQSAEGGPDQPADRSTRLHSRVPGVADRQDSAGYQRRPPALAERQDSASNIQAMEEAERELAMGTAESIGNARRRDSAEDMQFVSPSAANAGTAVLRSPRANMAAEGDADEVMHHLSIGSPSNRLVMRSDSARQQLLTAGFVPVPASSSAAPDASQPSQPASLPAQGLSGLTMQRQDSASEQELPAASTSSPRPEPILARRNSALAAEALLDQGDVPLGRKDSALDSLEAARRLVLQGQPDLRDRPMASPLSVSTSTHHNPVPFAQPSTSMATQAGPNHSRKRKASSSFHIMAEATSPSFPRVSSPMAIDQGWNQAGPSESAWEGQELTARQDSALDDLSAARATILRDLHELSPRAVLGHSTVEQPGPSNANSILRLPSVPTDPLAQARWLMARDAELYDPAERESSISAIPGTLSDMGPALRPYSSSLSMDTTALPASPSAPHLPAQAETLPVPVGAPRHRVVRDSATEGALTRKNSLAQARALLAAEFPHLALDDELRMDARQRMPDAHPDSPMFAGSPIEQEFSSGFDMQQSVTRIDGPGSI
ncbi:hypothetical protein WJX73_009928 [Symbiochloris irregularis]|uniref:Uncharacterized protein n=1 Tax=Symbiochloris irregularis TaxID=706552 RepID=A0AAW1PVG0_9CHLO